MMIPNLYIGNGWKWLEITKHLFINGWPWGSRTFLLGTWGNLFRGELVNKTAGENYTNFSTQNEGENSHCISGGLQGPDK